MAVGGGAGVGGEAGTAAGTTAAAVPGVLLCRFPADVDGTAGTRCAAVAVAAPGGSWIDDQAAAPSNRAKAATAPASATRGDS